MSTAQALRAVKAFRVRELARLPPLLGALPPNPSLFNPFLPSKNPVTGRWEKPVYSRRRQKELVKAATAANTLGLLPPGPKYDPNPTFVDPAEATARRKAKAVARRDAKRAAEAAKEARMTGKKGAAQPEPLEMAQTQMEREAGRAEEARPARALAWALRLSAPRAKGIWDAPVQWTGAVPPRKHAGALVKMYAGRKKMFKGHKWEREMPRKTVRRRILLRDMPKRVATYKAYYRRKRPNPLKPAKGAAKLPF